MTRLPALGPRGEGWVLVQGVLLVLVGAAGWSLGPDWSGIGAVVTTAVGVVSFAVGVLLAVRGLRDLGGALTPLPKPSDAGELVESGVYALMRHPIYSGVILMAFGWAMLRASVMAIVLTAVLAALLGLKSEREERWLEMRYPAYPAYRARTGRFIPKMGRSRG